MLIKNPNFSPETKTHPRFRKRNLEKGLEILVW